ncbi:phosphotransferase [Microbacterium sp. cx-55]|uniref:maltokinase N-terminal cap-like domain-containing protein n=1 Tax=Microbacterium sp. cx-55 TaxID=2875948 RepID=UPI001CC03FA3|nr:phosphotransferase [Microbacterium sp. cx-55]MBZ4485867.1 phosphotransferase [Microbacterium sp. cx-55]UGB34256.1 phosphotransferase [Microbacterium sp. cx-55]
MTLTVDLDTLSEWLPRQRWYATKGRVPRLRVIAAMAVPSPDPDAEIAVHLVIDEAHEAPVLYQVPVVSRSAAVDDGAGALIGRSGDRWLYDGPHDAAYAQALVAAMADSARVDVAGASLRGQVFSAPGRVTRAHVLSGEQSNTSLVCEVEGGSTPTAIVKVFRVLHHGENPDVTTQSALTAAGSHRVPASLGALVGTWPDPGRADGQARGHLAFAQEFLSGLQDAWVVARDAASRGEDFSIPARDLGVAVAEVHATLRGALPVVPAGPAEIESALVSLRRRLAIAVREVPALEPLAPRIEALYRAIAGMAWPALQRIHGDLHLGQAVRSPELGWVLLDFEGEPLRPMPERSRPDLPLRDVAGMLRSFDYVAGSLAQETPPIDAASWASTARNAFLDGYVAASGDDVRSRRALLDAFEIDKAVYEAIYEVRNRPAWIGIPLTAITRLVERSSPPV